MYTKNNDRATQEQAGLSAPTTATPPTVPSDDKDSNAQLVNSCEQPPDAPMVAQLVTEDDIRLYAYQKWEKAGRPAGDGSRFWLEAEREVARGK